MSPTTNTEESIKTTDLSTEATVGKPIETLPKRKETYREIMAKMKRSKKSDAERSEPVPIISIGGGQFTKIEKI